MANKRDYNYEDSTDSKNDAPSKKSLKESHEKAHDAIQGSGLRLHSVEGPASRIDPVSTFSVECKQGHRHVISVDHSAKGGAHVFSSSQAEDSDPDPEHQGTVKSAVAYLKKEHKHAKSESNSDED